MGWSVGRGCPLPTEEGVRGGGCAPSPEFFKFFLVQCVQKFFCVQAKGGGIAQCPPPKYATAHQLQVERRTGKVRRPETEVLPLSHATNIFQW